MGVTLSPGTPFTQNEPLARLCQVGQHFMVGRKGRGRVLRCRVIISRRICPSQITIRYCTYGDFEHGVGGCLSIHVLTHPMLTRLRSKQRAVKEIHQIVGVDICFQDNVSSPSSVSSIGAAFGHKLLPAETDTTVTTISGSCVDFYAINKHLSAPDQLLV